MGSEITTRGRRVYTIHAVKNKNKKTKIGNKRKNSRNLVGAKNNGSSSMIISCIHSGFQTFKTIYLFHYCYIDEHNMRLFFHFFTGLQASASFIIANCDKRITSSSFPTEAYTYNTKYIKTEKAHAICLKCICGNFRGHKELYMYDMNCK